MTTLTINSYGRVDPGLCPNCRTHSSFEPQRADFLWPHVVNGGSVSEPHLKIGGDLWLKQIVVGCRYCSKTVILQQMVRHTDAGWDVVGEVRANGPGRLLRVDRPRRVPPVSRGARTRGRPDR
ncbi:hypothetical protein ACWC5I_04795 [Kitasatospora sp. NPDC001574]